MEWNHLIYFALLAVFCWGMGAMAAYRPGKSLQVVLWTVAGLAIFMAFIVGMWVSLERPPLRTMGERSLGALLELGSERDLGSSDLAGQSAVYTLPVSEEQTV